MYYNINTSIDYIDIKILYCNIILIFFKLTLRNYKTKEIQKLIIEHPIFLEEKINHCFSSLTCE